MKNFSRRRGTVLAAAALSVALVAPMTQPIAGADDAAATTTVTTEAGKPLKFGLSKLKGLTEGAKVTVVFTTADGKTEEAEGKVVNKSVEVEIPKNAVDGLVTVKSGDASETIKVTFGKPVPSSTPSSSAASQTTSASATTSASSSSEATSKETSSETSSKESSSETSKATTSESSKSTSAKATTSSSKADAPATTPKNGLSSRISTNQTCESALIGWGIPLALLLPIGVIATVAIPGLESVTQAYSEAVRNANAELQNQLGIMNPELSRQVAIINDQLRMFGTDLAQVAVGSVLIGVGAGAIANIASACSGNGATQQGGGLTVSASVTFTQSADNVTTSKTQEPTATATTKASAEATTTVETTTSAAK